MDFALKNGLDIISQKLDFDFGLFNISARQNAEKGYRIVKKGCEVLIEYSTKSSFFSAILSLMARENEDFEESRSMFNGNLGLMVDSARNGVFNTESIKLFIINAALCGYNYLQLYVEDCMQIDGEPYFGHQRGAYTKEEIKEVVSFGEIFGIDLMPCIQTLAHLNQIFRWDGAFEDIRDCNDILFIGEEKTYILIEKMVKTAAQCYKSKRINICMDEAHMAGLGKYLDKNGYHDRFDMLINHLKRVISICKKYGFEPEMWGDMFFRIVFKEYYAFGKKFEKHFTDKIPEDINIYYWDYYHLNQSEYNEMIDLHSDLAKTPLKFAGGIYTWIGYAPLNNFSVISMTPALKACREKNIDDVLFTLWGDNGNECSRFSVLSSILYLAEKCYDEYINNDLLDKKLSALCSYTYEEMLALDNPNKLYEGKTDKIANPAKYLLYTDPLIFYIGNYIFDNYGEYYQKYYNQLSELAKRDSRYSYLFDTLAKLCKVLINKATLPEDIRNAYKANDKNKIKHIAEHILPRCIEDIKEFYAALKIQWHKENKRYGFEIQDIRIGGLIQRLENVSSILSDYVKGVINKLEELEEPYLDVYGTIKREGFKGFVFNHYDRIVSSSLL